MIDNPARSVRTQRRERALHVARQRLTRLEIEAHRIKAELARLESENEDEIADELTDGLWRDGARELGPGTAAMVPHHAPTVRLGFSPSQPTELDEPTPPIVPAYATSTHRSDTKSQKSNNKPRRVLSPAWMLSLAMHLAILAVLAPMTFVVLTNDRVPLLASWLDPASEKLDESEAAPIELVSYEEVEFPEATQNEPAEVAASLADDFALPDSEPGGQLASSLGRLSALPTDVGTLMAGGGSEGNGPAAGGSRRGAASDEARLGKTSFFGTPAQANRIVFLVDNSGSMKQGRMETTVFELARSVEAMTDKQEFYVAFYSDQAYPMFYPNSVMQPLAATRENKQRLYRWLPTVELCTGGALIKAMDLAESLQPDVVFILSDGNISGTRTMERLTLPSDRRFAIHTLGMGVAKPRDAQNLLAIAQANRGTFQMVQPMKAAVQSAKLRPIRSNGSGVGWGESLPQQFP
jgi:von Willebrand factor type A domain